MEETVNACMESVPDFVTYLFLPCLNSIKGSNFPLELLVRKAH